VDGRHKAGHDVERITGVTFSFLRRMAVA